MRADIIDRLRHRTHGETLENIIDLRLDAAEEIERLRLMIHAFAITNYNAELAESDGITGEDLLNAQYDADRFLIRLYNEAGLTAYRPQLRTIWGARDWVDTARVAERAAK